MLGIDVRVARTTWTAAVVLLAMALVWWMRNTLFLFTIAMMFAYLLYPLFDAIDRRMPGRSRTYALALTYVFVLGVMGAFAAFIGERVAGEAAQLAEQARQPGFADQVRNWQVLGFPVGEQIDLHYREIVGQLPRLSLSVLAAFSNVVYAIIVPIIAFFILRDGRRIRDSLLELTGRREAIEDLLFDAHLLMLQYMRALLVLCMATFVSFTIVLSALSLPYAVLLAAVAFPLEFIPLLGPLTAAALIIGVSVFSGYPHVLWVVAFLGAYRLFQDYVLSPHLMSKGVALHPALVIFGVLAGDELGGAAGVFLSVPVLALLRLAYHRLQKRAVLMAIRP
jgi:predicted PurR-regulated permease PerM